MELNYTFDTRQNDSQNYYYYTEGFSKEELDKIEKNVKELPWKIADTAGGDNSEIRRSKVKWVPQNEDWYWLYEKLANLRDKITTSKDLKKYSKELKSIEKEITLFHAKVSNTMIKNNSEWEPDIIGFHGQTIFHDSEEKLSVQLGDGNLLSQLTNKTVVYNFRQNDLKNGGQGAPLTPIFHQIIKSRLKDDWWPVLFLNIGGISNVTSTSKFLTISKNTNLDYHKSCNKNNYLCLIQ